MSLGYRFASLKFRAKMRPKLASESGLALMEVMTASVVFGMAMVGVILMLSLARSLNVAQGDTRVGFYLAQEKLEQLRALGFAAIPIDPGGSCPGTTCYSGPGESALTGGVANQTFTRVTSVVCVAKSNLDSPVACPTPPVLKRITVTVTLPMLQNSADPPVVLQTVLAKP